MALRDFSALARSIGVESINPGQITIVQNKSVDEVARALFERRLKFLGYFDADGVKLERNAIYLSVNGEILAAKDWTRVEPMAMIKPTGYRDSDSRSFYPC